MASKRSTREPPSINEALPKQRTRPLSTAAAVEAAARAKKRNDAPQSNIGFQKKDQYSIGMKLLLDESIYEKQNEVSYNLLSLYCNLFLGCLIQLTIIYFFPSQVPEEARGFLFEYQLIKVCRLGATIQYSNRMITPKGDKFCTFEETEDVQTMVLQLDERFKESHDLWQKANGRQNARIFHENEALKAAQGSDESVLNDVYMLEDIDDYFQKHGRGTHLLEYEFNPDPGGPVEYVRNGNNLTSRYWIWTHKITGAAVKRYATSSGKSFDSGRLSKSLSSINPRQFPLAYARAQKVLLLNESPRENSVDKVVPIALDRCDLLKQQVRL